MFSMKKSLKVAIVAAGIISAPIIANTLIFKTAGAKAKKRDGRGNLTSEKNYKWEYGNIRYTKTGNGGKPLLLLHDITPGGGGFEWEKTISQLSEHYTVYVPDLLGFGRSEKPGVSYSSFLYATMINNFIKNVIKKPAYVAASSVSASIALASYCLTPENMIKLMLISPIGAGCTNKSALNRDSFMKKLLESHYIGAITYNILSSRLFKAWQLKRYEFKNTAAINTSFLNKYYYSAHSGGVNSRLPIAALASGFLHVDIERLISRAEIPVHCIWGEENQLNPLSNFAYLEKQNESISLAVFKDTKTLPHYENPKAFCKECRWFFR